MRSTTWALMGMLMGGLVFGPQSLVAQSVKKPASASKANAKATTKAAPKAEWRAPPSTPEDAPIQAVTTPEAPVSQPAADLSPPDGLRSAQAVALDTSQPQKPLDESEELLALDRGFANSLATLGPLKAYEAMMSAEGVLHDASGSSPPGAAGAQSRFTTFPADVTLERSPESAMAAGGSGSSWGRYVIRKGETQLSLGRYVTVWRREAAGWLIVTELAAGRASPQAPAASGPLPRRPPSAAKRSAPTTPSN